MLSSKPSSTGISGTEASPSLLQGPPSAQNQMIHKGRDPHDTSCRCYERKREGSGDHRQVEGRICEHYQESETGVLNLGESLEAVKGMDIARIAPHLPTDDSLHRQILELQDHLQRVEAEKMEFINQGNHQEMDWFTVYSASTVERLAAEQKIQTLQENLHQAAVEHSQTRQQLEVKLQEQRQEKSRLDSERKQLVGRLATQEKQIAGLHKELNKEKTLHSDIKQHFEGKIRTLEDNLRKADARHSQTNQLLSLRSAELRSAEVFLNKADSFAREDLVTMLEKLNSQIFNAAAFMAESLNFDHPTGDPEIHSWLKGTIGPRMFSILATHSPQEDPLLLQLTLQHYMTTWCASSLASFSPHTKQNDFLREIYAKIRALGEYIFDTSKGGYLKVIQGTKVLPEDGAQ
jgi:hypothetical protein